MLAVLQIVLLAAFPVLAIVAALTDLTSYTIPNWITGALIAAFAAFAAVGGLPLPALGGHLLVGGIALAAGMVLFALGWVGGGDAKLMAGCCLWFGWPDAQAFLLDTALAGGAFAMLLLISRKELVRHFIPPGSAWVDRLITPGEPAPYGVAIAVGALACVPASELLRFVHTSY